MKKLLIILIVGPFISLAQVGVNTTLPNAMLDVTSTNNGILIPRVQLTSNTDNVTVVNPQGGALTTSTLVYNIAASGVVPNNVIAGFYYWDNAISRWTAIASNQNNWSLTGNAGTTPSTSNFGVPIIAGQHFIGTTDNQDLVFGTNNLEQIRIKGFNIGIGVTNPTARIDVFDQGLSPSLRINKFSSASTNTALDITTNSVPSSGGIITAASFRALNGANNYAIVVPANSGDVGIGTNTPSTKLHIVNPTAGAVRIQDGTQAAGRVLTSDATGLGTWQNPSTTNSWSLLGNTGITNPLNPVTYGTSTLVATENFVGTKDANDVVLATNNIERMRIKNGTGNVGIGTASPTQPLHVSKTSDANKSTILGEARQTSTTTDYDNIGVQGYGAGTSASGGFGYGVGVMGIGDIANSFHATGVYGYLGTTTPVLPQFNQAILGNGNNIGSAGIFLNGGVGIGTITPNVSSALEISSVTKGVLLPRMTRTQRNAIITPVAGLIVYQTDNIPGLRVYNGTNWMRFTETID